jgi:hypothetical protein
MIYRGGEAEREVGRLIAPAILPFVTQRPAVSTKLSPHEKSFSQIVAPQVENEIIIIILAKMLHEAGLGTAWMGRERREVIEVDKTMV